MLADDAHGYNTLALGDRRLCAGVSLLVAGADSEFKAASCRNAPERDEGSLVGKIISARNRKVSETFSARGSIWPRQVQATSTALGAPCPSDSRQNFDYTPTSTSSFTSTVVPTPSAGRPHNAIFIKLTSYS